MRGYQWLVQEAKDYQMVVPVDEWGIRMEPGSCNPVGANVSRGGATNGPAAVYAIRKWDEWLRQYAPPGAAAMDFYQSLPSLSSGNVAQQIFWYTAFTASLVGKILTIKLLMQTVCHYGEWALHQRTILGTRYEAWLSRRWIMDFI